MNLVTSMTYFTFVAALIVLIGARPEGTDLTNYLWANIAYATDYPLIPGIANLYHAYGLSSTLDPISAFLGGNTYKYQGYRATVGFFLAFAWLIVLLTIASSKKSVPPANDKIAFLALQIPSLFLISLMCVWQPGEYLSTPNRDVILAIAVSLSTGFLLRGLIKTDSVANLVAASVLAALTFTIRPQYALFTSGVLIIACTILLRQRKLLITSCVVFATMFFCAVGVIRSLRISGHFFFPITTPSLGLHWEYPRRILASLDIATVTKGATHPSGIVLRLPLPDSLEYLNNWLPWVSQSQVVRVGVLVTAISLLLFSFQKRAFTTRLFVAIIPNLLVIIATIIWAPNVRYFAFLLPILGLTLLVAYKPYRQLFRVKVSLAFALVLLCIITWVRIPQISFTDLTATSKLDTSKQGWMIFPELARPEVFSISLDGATIWMPLETESPGIFGQGVCSYAYPFCGPEWEVSKGLRLIGTRPQNGFALRY